MSARQIVISALVLPVLVACSGTGVAPPIGSSEPSAPGTEVDAGVGVVEPGPDGPHALGSILLGESHGTASATPRRIVAVTFVPDAATVAATTRNVAGCMLTVPAVASGDHGEADATESFDAGPVAISGATAPITLFPPYTYEGETEGAPFQAGAKLRVQGSGAAGAGFEAFDETFTATQPVQTSPALAKLPRTAVFGTASLPLAWTPGADQVWITASGAGGSLRCKADDVQGHFDVPREVIKTALGTGTTLTLSVARERTETKKGKKTKGALASRVVQPVGWLSLSTTSIEVASFQCSGAECTGTPPVVTCNDCSASACKTELDACAADATCPMLRACLDACADGACRNACFAKWPQAAAKAKNGAVYKCQCIDKCVSQCATECG